MAMITVKNAHGLFTVSEKAFDIAIERYLPASPDQLRAKMDEVIGFEKGQYDDVLTVGEMVIMLADPIQGELNEAAAAARDKADLALATVRNNAHFGGAGMQSYDTYLGQIWTDPGDGRGPRWVDYARSDEAGARAWYTQNMRDRRVVDWIDKGRVIFGSES